MMGCEGLDVVVVKEWWYSRRRCCKSLCRGGFACEVLVESLLQMLVVDV